MRKKGAARCVFVDDHGPSRALIRENVEKLGLMGATKIWRRDATRLGPNRDAPYDLVFLDPPYRKGLAAKALASAADGGWIAPNALIILEQASDEDPPGFGVVADDRAYGDTRVLILRP